MTGNKEETAPEPVAKISQQHFKQLTAAANAGDQEALATLKNVLDDSPRIWAQLGDLSKQSEAALLDLASQGNQAVRESIVRQLRALREELGYGTADLLGRMGIERVVLSWLQLHLAERNLANDTPGSPQGNVLAALAAASFDNSCQRDEVSENHAALLARGSRYAQVEGGWLEVDHGFCAYFFSTAGGLFLCISLSAIWAYLGEQA